MNRYKHVAVQELRVEAVVDFRPIQHLLSFPEPKTMVTVTDLPALIVSILPRDSQIDVQAYCKKYFLSDAVSKSLRDLMLKRWSLLFELTPAQRVDVISDIESMIIAMDCDQLAFQKLNSILRRSYWCMSGVQTSVLEALNHYLDGVIQTVYAQIDTGLFGSNFPNPEVPHSLQACRYSFNRTYNCLSIDEPQDVFLAHSPILDYLVYNLARPFMTLQAIQRALLSRWPDFQAIALKLATDEVQKYQENDLLKEGPDLLTAPEIISRLCAFDAWQDIFTEDRWLDPSVGRVIQVNGERLFESVTGLQISEYGQPRISDATIWQSFCQLFSFESGVVCRGYSSADFTDLSDEELNLATRLLAIICGEKTVWDFGGVTVSPSVADRPFFRLNFRLNSLISAYEVLSADLAQIQELNGDSFRLVYSLCHSQHRDRLLQQFSGVSFEAATTLFGMLMPLINGDALCNAYLEACRNHEPGQHITLAVFRGRRDRLFATLNQLWPDQWMFQPHMCDKVLAVLSAFPVDTLNELCISPASRSDMSNLFHHATEAGLRRYVLTGNPIANTSITVLVYQNSLIRGMPGVFVNLLVVLLQRFPRLVLEITSRITQLELETWLEKNEVVYGGRTAIPVQSAFSLLVGMAARDDQDAWELMQKISPECLVDLLMGGAFSGIGGDMTSYLQLFLMLNIDLVQLVRKMDDAYFLAIWRHLLSVYDIEGNEASFANWINTRSPHIVLQVLGIKIVAENYSLITWFLDDPDLHSSLNQILSPFLNEAQFSMLADFLFGPENPQGNQSMLMCVYDQLQNKDNIDVLFRWIYDAGVFDSIRYRPFLGGRLCVRWLAQHRPNFTRDIVGYALTPGASDDESDGDDYRRYSPLQAQSRRVSETGWSSVSSSDDEAER